ncbi:hypothetical protein [Streptomyces sp. NPDC127190]
MSERDVVRVFRTFNAAAPEYASVPDLLAEGPDTPEAGTDAQHDA